MHELLAAALILKLHALGTRWLIDTLGDNAPMTDGLEALWDESLAAVGGDWGIHTIALNLSIDLWPAPYEEVNC